MPNGEELNTQLEFKERVKAMPVEERTVFIAEQIFLLTQQITSLNIHATARKAGLTTGGVAGTVMAIIIGIINYFLRRG